jgi:transposase
MSEGSEARQETLWAEGELPPRPEVTERLPGPQGGARFQPVDRQQMLLRPVEVDKLVEPQHWVRAVWEMTGQLDLTAYTEAVRAVEGVAGRRPYDPRLLISLWIYAYSEKVSSAREVARRCEYHPAYQWLTGCEVVNYHTLADFRVDHQAALDRPFAQLLAALSSEGLISLEQVQRLEQALEELQKVQAAAQAEAEPAERRVSATEAEARLMKQPDGGSAPSHNVQISTDTAHSIIVGVGVTPEGNDQHQLIPAVEQVEQQNGRAPQQMIVDDGYTTRANILAADRGLDMIGGTMEDHAEATRRRLQARGLAPEFYPHNFPYHSASNSYTCPAGQTLAYQRTQHDRVGVERDYYQARAADCRDCALRQACQPGQHGRMMVRQENVPTVAAYLAKMQTEAARAAYRRRAPVAEFSNLWLKAKLGLR